MKSPLKPPFKATAKAPSAGDRPAFPVRLKPDMGVPSAIKSVATFTRTVWDEDNNKIRKSSQSILPSGVGLDSQVVRARMVHKLAAQGVSDAKVLAAMGLVERHHFVDTALANQAYEDTSLPIGLGQTISKPNVVARMLELLRHGAAGKLGRVLEIGTGCGYQAAVLSHLATEVYSIERLRGLHDKARENLRTLRLPNVHLLFGDGMMGFAKGAPYAAIIAAAGGEAIPSAWIEQLAMGGRLVAPLQTASGAQALVVLDKTPQGVRQTQLEAVHFVPLKSGMS
ncbi:MAG TPA: protein-L-isoaspartate(D-aspartate) O-methyltransferase [Polaromonas sp.]|nr:protein-L-isoaspartate(D-aspartate) O-methyltransferase [Polaromonas sp.]